ncbi:TetR family transcriptional regulator [Marinithermofilum abyssi]|uniref:TetR family transcriptional regulator n=1 Tax=Marinithermofilum abyssi TaxID=1571185 RepID=A0A8J2VGY4_9BACL|nr:TetR/AcrR family transcriptional regulator [Marinithermofilum abyssi]GGE04395.1 TetR family transcriptional regulator [Marinithermofilum abyssi]
MPRSPQQNQAIREKRIQQILEATLKVYRERGYHRAEIGEIARVAGLGRGLIYYYFKDKQDVFLTLIRRSLEEWKRYAEAILQLDLPAGERLKMYLKEFCHLCLEYPDMTYFHQSVTRDLNIIFPDQVEEVMGYYEEGMWKPVRRVIREGVESGELREISPDMAERVFFSVVMGAFAPDYTIAENQVDDLVEAALYGLIPERK